MNEFTKIIIMKINKEVIKNSNKIIKIKMPLVSDRYQRMVDVGGPCAEGSGS